MSVSVAELSSVNCSLNNHLSGDPVICGIGALSIITFINEQHGPDPFIPGQSVSGEVNSMNEPETDWPEMNTRNIE